MPYGIYLSAEGAAVQAQRLDVIANNMANADTVGFKQDVPTFQARFSEAIQQGTSTPYDQSINDIGGGVKVIDVSTDFSLGQIQPTGKKFDMAITGKGFFHVRGDDGQIYLSRAGNFTLDTEGRLVTELGRHPVLDQQNEEIELDPVVPWSISQDGFIAQSGNFKAVGLSEPASLDDLVKVGNNMFRSLTPLRPLEVTERSIRQGYLELSGSNPIRQMMAMIETTRAFEANSRMIQNQDNVVGTLISRVLRT